MTKDEYVEYVKSTFITMGRKSVMTALTVQFPILANPFLNKIVELVVSKIVTIIVVAAEMQAFFFYTDFRVAKQSEEYIAAALANKKAQESGTPEEKKIAEENLINIFRTFAKFTG
jgi:hypothetical protein